ncbi:MAG: hypothetical protein KJO70_00230 [Gammaproteobacteria bacterium]|nr:hypothetical protein [Gammaproteobacteria bacterium]
MNRDHLNRLQPLNLALLEAWGPEGNPQRESVALRAYLDTRSALSKAYRMFEIANHRIFHVPGGLLVPYDAHGLLMMFLLEPDEQRVLFEEKLPHGTIIDDQWVLEKVGIDGRVIDLQRKIYHLDVDDMETVHVNRLRDLAGTLERINESGSRHEVVYLLRFLVARLCTSAYRSFAGAKNLQPEIHRVRQSLLIFLEGPFANRLGLPTRILVRHISGLVTQPRLIERVWQDTIDLCEVHVRNSSITNEIRRSTHHSLGWSTLELTQAYLEWLAAGEALFPDPEHMVPGESDRTARDRPDVVSLTERIATDLEKLLGGAQIPQRLDEWRRAFNDDLQRCDSGLTLIEEVERMVEEGAVAENRWSWLQHLRIIRRWSDDHDWPQPHKDGFLAVLESLGDPLPGEAEFSVEAACEQLRAASADMIEAVRTRHRDGLFDQLARVEESVAAGRHLEVFQHCSRVRHDLEALTGGAVFETQRLLLYQLDCLLEEAGYYALRHVAHDYAEFGMNLPECLSIIRRCAANLVFDGLFSRELWDLSLLLIDPTCSDRALLDVLEQLQRNYHRMVRRVSEAYEVMAGHLGYSEDDMRGVLGNFFRSMHDLNNLAHFSDVARAWLAANPGSVRQLDWGDVPARPWDFLHLSHDEEIVQRVEDFEGRNLRDIYGGKGSGLVYLSYLGVPTRDGFIIPTVLTRRGLHRSERGRLEAAVREHLGVLEADITREDAGRVCFGDPRCPLLLAVRGGSVFSMPGQLETIVFVGMTRVVAEALAEEDEWFAWDAFRRFLVSYAAPVWGLDLEALDLVDRAKEQHGVELKIQLSGAAMREVVDRTIEAIHEAGHGEEIERLLDDAEWQLHSSVQAVCASWDSTRARRYREIKHMSERWNTAVIVQQMAAGNHTVTREVAQDETRLSLTGVIPRTRMEPTGFRSFTGDIKLGASGDDLVGGLTQADSFQPVQQLHDIAPMLERRIHHINSRIRRFMGTDAEIEFTVDRGVLSVLQTRSAETEHQFEPRTFREPGEACGRGIGVMGGAFRGVAAFSEKEAQQLRSTIDADDAAIDGVLLILENPVPDEIPLILSVDGLLAARGGSTAHAAVAVNGIDDRPYSAVLGVSQMKVEDGHATVFDPSGEVRCTIHTGDVVSIHGQTGEVFIGSREVYA